MSPVRPAAVTVDVGALAPEDVVAVARDGAPVVLSDAALVAIDRARSPGLRSVTIPFFGDHDAQP